ncbi:terminus macrodomain insulation protein YfbV [Spirabiliibacterium falconis]|uniref:terminus macrodomain insulation protein YfbV n=1 Tax=Spirabiliibacterium falconis TaxID=572023 RepID=UPI001AACD3FB|nr:terminus macrodomain insulation protein YfbV [Spirabiliibacterium falconis]MBE2894201.1 DUF412 family protein [Spirabiliibacterium falconis]
MSLLKTYQQGREYLNLWVLHPKLGMIFPENRIIRAVRFAEKIMPAVAVLAIVWQRLTMPHSQMALAAAIITALFALSLPLQGIFWLGKRAKTPLNERSRLAYMHICDTLQSKGIAVERVAQPHFYDLARVLNHAQRHLDDEFWREL